VHRSYINTIKVERSSIFYIAKKKRKKEKGERRNEKGERKKDVFLTCTNIKIILHNALIL
jgi:hypothetical protein